MPRWIWPLAHGGPSCRTVSARRPAARESDDRADLVHQAMVSGSAACRLAFIGNSVRGRLSVSSSQAWGRSIALGEGERPPRPHAQSILFLSGGFAGSTCRATLTPKAPELSSTVVIHGRTASLIPATGTTADCRCQRPAVSDAPNQAPASRSASARRAQAWPSRRSWRCHRSLSTTSPLLEMTIGSPCLTCRLVETKPVARPDLHRRSDLTRRSGWNDPLPPIAGVGGTARYRRAMLLDKKLRS